MAHRTCGWFLVPASLGLALLLWSGTSAAQTPTAVLGIEPIDAPDELAAELSEALKLRVQRSTDYLLQSGKALDEIKLVFGCLDENPACMAKAGQTLQVQKMIWGSLKQVPAGLNLTIKLLDVESAREEKFVSENFDLGALEQAEADEVIKKLTASFLAGKTGALRVRSTVPGARVLVDGQTVGTTPPEGLLVEELEPGLHQVKVEQQGYQPFTGQVAVVSGQTVSLAAQLDPLATTPAPPVPALPDEPEPEPEPSRRAGWQVAFWSSLAVSLGLAAAAVTTGVQSWGYEEDVEALLINPDSIRQDLYEGDASKIRGEIPDACSPPSGVATDGQLRDLCDKGQSRATLTTGLWIAAGSVAVLTGVFGYLAFRNEERAAEPADLEARALRWQIVPSLAPQAASLDLTLRF